MALIAAIGLLVLLALAAPRWGHDSRQLGTCDGWFGAPRPRRPRSSRPGLAAFGAWLALAGAQRARGALQSAPAPRRLSGLVVGAICLSSKGAPARGTGPAGGPLAVAQ